MELVVCSSRFERTRGEASGFPSDVIEEILSRLDAQSVMRCKCVCKSWLSLITHPGFKHRHLKNQVPGAFLRNYDVSRAFSFHRHNSSNDQNPHQMWDYPCPNIDHVVTRRNTLSLRVVGCENGVICFFFRDVVYLCNPAIRKLTKLHSPPPSPPPPPAATADPTLYIYGLGYDALTDDFKVVSLAGRQQGAELINYFKRGNLVGVYSLRSHSWKTLEMPDLFSASSSIVLTHPSSTFVCSVVVNGSIHWLVDYGRRDEERFLDSVGIVAFDMSTEVFKLFNSPPSLKGLKAYRFRSMCDCSGSLSLLTFHKPGLIEIWVMREYGVSDSWTKRFSLDFSKNLVPVRTDDDYLHPMGLYSNGDLLFYYPRGFCFYNSKCNRIEHLCPAFRIVQFTTYVESIFLS